MNEVEMKANWSDMQIRLKQKYGILTNSDVTWVDGKHDQLLNKLNLILGVSKEDLQKFIEA